MADRMSVPVKSDWMSKVNWTQILSVAASLATFVGLTVPPDLIPAAVVLINAVGGVVTIVLRTWFTREMLRSSV